MGVDQFVSGGALDTSTLDSITIDDDGSIRLDTSDGNGVFIPDDQEFFWGSDLDYFVRYDSTDTQLELGSADIDGGGTTGDVLRIGDGAGDVTIPNGDLRFATEQSIRDTGGTERIRIDSSHTGIFGDGGTLKIEADEGTGRGVRISAHSGEEIAWQDVTTSGNDRVLGYDASDGFIRVSPDGAHDLNLNGNLLDDAIGLVYQERAADPGTGDLDASEVMLYISDGTADVTGDVGDLVYARNNAGTIETTTIVDATNAS